MGIILWVIFGALVGWAASAVMGSRSGLLWDIIIGIVGSILGGSIMSFLGESSVTGFNLYSFLVALIGACVLIALMRAIRGQN